MGAERPFKFGVQATAARSAGEWTDLARRVEALGYATLFLADHYLGKGPAAQAARQPPQHLAPIAAMAHAAAVTSTLRVGCRVFCIDYHVPAVLAKEAATIDLLSDGRLEFGIGAGWSAGEYASMGLGFGPAGERVDKLVEVVALVKAHWAGEQLEIVGDHATATGYAGLPRPVQRPHPPIMIGGGKRRVLTLAAREADIVSINNVPFDATDDGLSPSEEAERRLGFVSDAAGARMTDLDIESSPFFTEITDDPSAAAGRIAAMLGTDPERLVAHPNVLIGTVDALVDRLLERRERFGANYISVQQAAVESFSPVVERLVGR